MVFGFSWFGLSAAVTALISLAGFAAHQDEPDDPMEDLTFRLRHPVKYSLLHPVRAILRHRKISS